MTVRVVAVGLAVVGLVARAGCRAVRHGARHGEPAAADRSDPAERATAPEAARSLCACGCASRGSARGVRRCAGAATGRASGEPARSAGAAGEPAGALAVHRCRHGDVVAATGAVASGVALPVVLAVRSLRTTTHDPTTTAAAVVASLPGELRRSGPVTAVWLSVPCTWSVVPSTAATRPLAPGKRACPRAPPHPALPAWSGPTRTWGRSRCRLRRTPRRAGPPRRGMAAHGARVRVDMMVVLLSSVGAQVIRCAGRRWGPAGRPGWRGRRRRRCRCASATTSGADERGRRDASPAGRSGWGRTTRADDAERDARAAPPARPSTRPRPGTGGGSTRGRGAERLAQTDLADPLGDRDQHDVHDADAADQQRDRGDAGRAARSASGRSRSRSRRSDCWLVMVKSAVGRGHAVRARAGPLSPPGTPRTARLCDVASR